MIFHYLCPILCGLPDLRLTEYAMATACFTGLPALTSALMLALKAFCDLPLVNGMWRVLF